MQRIIYSIIAVIAMGLALWLAATLFVGLAIIGFIAYGLYYGRDFLIRKGILNPRPGVPLEESHEEHITVIEGDFERIDDEDPK